MAGLSGSMAHDHFGDAIRDKFFEFLETFTTANAAYSMSQASAATAGEETQQYYIEQLKAMRESEKTTLFVDWQHLVSVDADMADELEIQYLRVDPFLRKVTYRQRLALIFLSSAWLLPHQHPRPWVRHSPQVLPQMRMCACHAVVSLHVQAVQNLVRKYQENYVESEESGEREFWVAFYNLPKKLALRGLKTQQIGRLVSFRTSFCSADCTIRP